MKPIDKLLAFIRSDEAPKGYGQIYGGAKGVSLSTDVSKMTLNQVIALQDQMLRNKSASTAVGGYQFIQRTLIGTMSGMKLTGKEVWTPELQDKMAIHLMKGRGLDSYLAGTMSAENFANNLAKEWASLPVVTSILGFKKFVLKPGQSYYAGDGLNKSRHDPKQFLALVKILQEPFVADDDFDKPVVVVPEPIKPKGFWAWFKSLFS